MKAAFNRLLVATLLFALAATPLFAQTTAPAEAPEPPSAPAPPPPPAPDDQTGTIISPATNEVPVAKGNQNQRSNLKKKSPDGDHTPVRIDATGIHVGGPDPVDINLPDFASNHGSGHVLRGDEVVAIVGTLVVFGSIVVICALFFLFRNRRNRMLHETLRAMVDKGVAIPPELLVPPSRNIRRLAQSDLRNGLIWLGAGIAVIILAGKWGLIPAFVGVAFLITWLVEKKNITKEPADK